jgi:hypothetical protein
MTDKIERLEVPMPHYTFAARRMKAFVEFAVRTAHIGTLDLNNLAISAYLQGVWDGAVMQAKSKVLPDDIGDTEIES